MKAEIFLGKKLLLSLIFWLKYLNLFSHKKLLIWKVLHFHILLGWLGLDAQTLDLCPQFCSTETIPTQFGYIGAAG